MEKHEELKMDSKEYSNFGMSDDYLYDPVKECLPGHFMDNNPQTANLGMCPAYMSQRCSQKWDDNCAIYINSLNDQVSLKKFIRDTMSKKYCQLDKNSSCAVTSQPFDPIAQTSPNVYSYIGNDVVHNSNETVDIGWYHPLNISPDYMKRCNQVCDIKGGDEGTEVLNMCLTYGFCNDMLANMCQLGNIPSSGLATFCDKLKPQKSQEKFTTKEKMHEEPEDKNISIITMCIIALGVAIVLYTIMTCGNKPTLKKIKN